MDLDADIGPKEHLFGLDTERQVRVPTMAAACEQVCLVAKLKKKFKEVHTNI